MPDLTQEQIDEAKAAIDKASKRSDGYLTFSEGLEIAAPFLQFSSSEHRIDECILKELRGISKLLHHIYRCMPNRVLGGVMSQSGDTMSPIAPGTSPQFTVTPTPTGVVTEAANASWAATSSDSTPITITPDTDDTTGLSATVALPDTIAAGAELTITWTYMNADSTTVDVVGTFPVVAVVPPVTDVTGGTMAQSA